MENEEGIRWSEENEYEILLKKCEELSLVEDSRKLKESHDKRKALKERFEKSREAGNKTGDPECARSIMEYRSIVTDAQKSVGIEVMYTSCIEACINNHLEGDFTKLVDGYKFLQENGASQPFDSAVAGIKAKYFLAQNRNYKIKMCYDEEELSC